MLFICVVVDDEFGQERENCWWLVDRSWLEVGQWTVDRGRGRRHGLDVLCVVPLIAVFKIKSIRNNT
jgi:hypothetical protein